MGDAVLFSNGIGNFIMATPFISQLADPVVIIPQEDARREAIASISLWPVLSVPQIEIKKLAGRYARLFVLWCFPRGLEPTGPNVTRQPEPDWKSGIHETESYLAVLGESAKPIPTSIKSVLSWELHLGRGERLVALCNGASRAHPAWANKRWPAERFGALAVELLKHEPSLQFVFLGDEQEAAIGETIVKNIGPRCWNFAGVLSFAESCGVLARADLVVTNDSALMHAADALNRPVVVIGNFACWTKSRPWNGNVVAYLASPGGGCQHFPCYGKAAMWQCRNNLCVQAIPVKTVADEVKRVLTK